MTVAARRRFIVRACKQRSWIIQPAALQSMMDYVHSEEALDDILDAVEGRIGSGKTITAEIWDSYLLDEQRRQEEVSQKGRSRQRHQDIWTDEVQIVGAFETPKLIYDVTRKQFYIKEKQESLFGSPNDKTNMLAQRYALVHQRLMRHKLFRPNQLGHGARTASQHQLTPVESLIGKKAMSKTFLILGILIQIEEGNYYLEDPTGQVPVSFREATAVDHFFVTEHCILLVEGSFHDGTFYIQRVGHPLLENREVSLTAMAQQLSHPLFSKKEISSANEDPCFVVLSDVHLDQPKVIQQLEALFATYEKASPDGLPLFVLMGNFSSMPRDSPPIEELATVLSAFSNLSKYAHFVLIPGPSDTSQRVLPLPSIAAKLARVANVHFTTNPSRIYYRGRELVLFNYNILHLLQRKQLPLPLMQSIERDVMDELDLEPGSDQRKLHHCLIKTILDQGHLLPVQGIPIFWNYDHALRLYPLPDALILGGDALEEGFHEVYKGCHVLHAGSMGKTGSYALFRLNGENEDVLMEDDKASANHGSVVFHKFSEGVAINSFD